MTEGLEITAALVRSAALIYEISATASAEHHLTPQQAQLINAVRERPTPMSRLAALLRIGKPAATGLVDRAEAAGLIRRGPDPEDGRVLLIELTPFGRAKADAFRRTVTDRVAAVIAPLGEQQREQLRQALSVVVLARQARDTWPVAPSPLPPSPLPAPGN